MENYYSILEQTFEKIYYYKSIISLLHWDSDVNLPSASINLRAKQLSTLQTNIYQLCVDKKTTKLLNNALQEQPKYNSWQQSNLDCMLHIIKFNSALPQKFLEKFSSATINAEREWRKAKEKKQYKNFSSHLANVINCVIEKSKILSDKFECNPYEALMLEYDPGIKINFVDNIFSNLKNSLPPIAEKIYNNLEISVSKQRTSLNLATTLQEKVCRELLKDMGFDYKRGRLDKTSHPFTQGTREDIRVAINYQQDNFIQTMLACLHEAGHALYDLNLPEKWQRQPVGADRGMMFHEGIALFYEMAIGRSKEFALYLSTLLKNLNIDGISIEDIKSELLSAKPSIIRIEADEVAYPLHIFLRYELEKKLLDKDITTEDIPAIWEEYSVKYLSLKPKDDAEGALQDIHWALGLFGYFPSYGLGAIFAMNLKQKLQQQVGTFDNDIRSGNFNNINLYLAEHVFNNGCFYTIDKHIEALFKEFSVNAYIENLSEKYKVIKTL